MQKKKYIRGATLDEVIAGEMKDPAFRKLWHGMDADFDLMRKMIEAREKARLSQKDLAQRIGTKQSAISRLERGAFKKATVETLEKIADALNFKLVIELQPKKVIVR
jgi:ribosome-binding protein aMBF1 (putative translation factor)